MTAPLPRVIVVTGAASGIGNATVLRFLAAGDHPTVVAADLAYPAGASLREQPDRMIAYGLDHSEAEAVGELMEWIRHRYGRIDVLCVVAGVAGPLSPVAEQRPDDWRTVQDANLLGAFLIARAAVPLLSEGHDPAVVFGASTAGLFGQANAGPYAAAKAGIVALARTLAVELGPVGIRVNVVCPGAVDTPITLFPYTTLFR